MPDYNESCIGKIPGTGRGPLKSPTQSPIRHELEELGKMLNTIGENIDELRGWIIPILNPDSIPPGAERIMEEEIPNLTRPEPQLATEIHNLFVQANLINISVVRLKDRIAL
jgi:hypothetical protein